MPLNADAQKYAQTLFTERLEQISREYQSKRIATANDFSRRGLIQSGMYYSALANLSVEHVGAIAHAKVDSLIAAYERSKQPFDQEAAVEVTRQAMEWCDGQAQNAKQNVRQQAQQSGMTGLDSSVNASVERGISQIRGEVQSKITAKALEAKFDARAALDSRAPEPEILDDLLPIRPRRSFDSDSAELIAGANESAGPTALIMIDIDDFKKVNDGFGHDVGDEVLKGIASVVNSVCQFKGRCYRYGGDELVVLLRNYSMPEAAALAQRIREAVTSYRFASYPKHMTLSIGVACYPGSCETGDELFKAADAAAYRAKQNGKNQVCLAEPSAIALA